MSEQVVLKFYNWYKENKRFRHRITMLGIFNAGYEAGLKETKVSEPQYLEGDDTAIKDECEYCGYFTFECQCAPYDPDTLHDQRFDD